MTMGQTDGVLTFATDSKYPQILRHSSGVAYAARFWRS